MHLKDRLDLLKEFHAEHDCGETHATLPETFTCMEAWAMATLATAVENLHGIDLTKHFHGDNVDAFTEALVKLYEMGVQHGHVTQLGLLGVVTLTGEIEPKLLIPIDRLPVGESLLEAARHFGVLGGEVVATSWANVGVPAEPPTPERVH